MILVDYMLTEFTDIDLHFIQFLTTNSVYSLFVSCDKIKKLIENSKYFDGLLNIDDVYKVGNVSTIKLLLNDINYIIENISFISAINYGHLAVVKLLHRYDIDIKMGGNSPILCACSRGNLEIVKYLHENGAYIHDNLVLDYATNSNSLPIIKYLHNSGIEISVNGYRYCILITAVSKGYIDIVEYLHKNGVNIRIDDDLALQIAAKYGHIEIVKYLHVNGCSVSSGNNSAITWAANRGHYEIVKYLHKNGADIRTNDAYIAGFNKHGHNYSLRWIAENNYYEIGEYLYKNKAI